MKKNLFSVSLLFLAGLVSLWAQSTALDPAPRSRVLSWTNPFPRASSSLLYATNLGSNALWFPARQVLGSNAQVSIPAVAPFPSQAFYRVQVHDVSALPTNLALIPAGPFLMGNSQTGAPVYFNNETPVHSVQVGAFLMDRFEVSNEEMRRVLQWAYDQGLVGADSTIVTNREGDARRLMDFAGDDHGYPLSHMEFTNGVFYVQPGREFFPCTGVTWYGALAYCNYRSDMEGLERCITFTNRITASLSDWRCDFSKNGYRLPTEAEWEKAARGGLTGHYYPWPSSGGSYEAHWNPGFANCNGTYDPFEATSYATPVGYYNGQQVPAGPDMPNGYGLYDMAGNVWEWCWDYFQNDWYRFADASLSDTRGPNGPFAGNLFLQYRVIRGGGGGYYSMWLRTSCRHLQGWSPDYASAVLGFRPVRND